MQARIRFARWVFITAAVYGLLVMLPQYFIELQVGRNHPLIAIHPERFYGFIGLAVVWQLAFLLIASDVVHYRSLMPVAVLEKLAFGLPIIVLYAQSRTSLPVLAVALIDLMLGVVFLFAYLRLKHRDAVL